MPNPPLFPTLPNARSPQLETFPTPTDAPFVVEHVCDEFTSVCPKTGHPDFGTVTVRFQPRGGRTGPVAA